MNSPRINGYPVLIIGAGRGGSALLEMFLEDELATVVAIVDSNPNAPGIVMAAEHNITTYSDAVEALQACKNYPDCIVYNLSHDDSIADKANAIFGDKRVTGGTEVKLFWQMVTNLKQMKVELEKSQNQLQAIIHNAMDGIITLDEGGTILGFNPAASQIFGYSDHEILGKSIRKLMPTLKHAAHGTDPNLDIASDLRHILGMHGHEVTAVRKNGDSFPIEISVSEMTISGHQFFVGIVRDVTERKQAEEKISHLAHHDSLTDLPNRTLFLTILKHSVLTAQRNKQHMSVLFLDLDGFKKINDTLGHDIGDLLLQEVAKRLQETIRASDSVARVGGDEFIFVLNDTKTDDNAALVAKKLIDILAKPFALKSHQCHIGGSIGIATFPDCAVTPEQLVKQADEAMYESKHSGRNTYRFYRDVVKPQSA
ncbi:MAG: diguanylate cyclase with PAS/PAC sensor [Gallionellaceae bacterium]|nr:MAG: diguanylate cyclase with PAS/PAC sensor [Gallionellaceae bacterium]